MLKKLYVITAPEVIIKKKVSFEFMFKAGLPGIWPYGIPYGYISLNTKEADYFDVWKWAKGEKDYIGNTDGALRWQCYLFQSGVGNILSSSGDATTDHSTLKNFFDNMPNRVIILLHKGLFETVQQVAKELNVEVEAYHCSHELETYYS